MFIVTELSRPAYKMESIDTKDVGDIVIGITGSESEGKRATLFSGMMSFGDKLQAKEYAIECVEE